MTTEKMIKPGKGKNQITLGQMVGEMEIEAEEGKTVYFDGDLRAVRSTGYSS